MKSALAIGIACSLLLGGCASMSSSSSATAPTVSLPAKVTAVGYGTSPTVEGLSPDQRRILALRASKLDAYRALAETVSGLKIVGNSTVNAATMTNDSFRVYLEAYLRGARVVSVTPLPGNGYETVLELELTPDFQRDALRAAPPPVQVQDAPARAPESLAQSRESSNNYYLAQ
ncbi:LPP20 family lipoprotein [Chitinilyticum litopenaei]|uniref:LPP20 family lipoprotein n=1 Tax=Chitinilyticum litopenaei TaxID=1121276 RepID=UPI0003FAB48A|nr:LPP20 family lipoprotein [Chitinilyticum litopenaei]